MGKVPNPIYKDLNINDHIKRIPEVINDNFKKTRSIFESIIEYNNSQIDASCYVKIPIITNGIIKGNTGEFNNIKFNELSSETSNNAFLNIKTNHNKSINRFKDSRLTDQRTDYAHDVDYICYIDSNNNIISLNDKIDIIDNSIKNVNTTLNNNTNNITTINNNLAQLRIDVDILLEHLNINKSYNNENNVMTLSISNDIDNSGENIAKIYNSKPNSYTYPAKMYSAGILNGTKYDYDIHDIKNNNKFRYYIVNSNYIKINNQYNVCLHTDKIGTEVNIIIDEELYNNDLIIKLNYDGISYEYIKIYKDDIKLARLCLVCIDINEYGEKWYIKNYSGKIELIK